MTPDRIGVRRVSPAQPRQYTYVVPAAQRAVQRSCRPSDPPTRREVRICLNLCVRDSLTCRAGISPQGKRSASVRAEVNSRARVRPVFRGGFCRRRFPDSIIHQPYQPPFQNKVYAVIRGGNRAAPASREQTAFSQSATAASARTSNKSNNHVDFFFHFPHASPRSARQTAPAKAATPVRKKAPVLLHGDGLRKSRAALCTKFR